MIQDLTEQIIEWIRFYSILSEPITDYWFSVLLKNEKKK